MGCLGLEVGNISQYCSRFECLHVNLKKRSMERYIKQLPVRLCTVLVSSVKRIHSPASFSSDFWEHSFLLPHQIIFWMVVLWWRNWNSYLNEMLSEYLGPFRQWQVGWNYTLQWKLLSFETIYLVFLHLKEQMTKCTSLTSLREKLSLILISSSRSLGAPFHKWCEWQVLLWQPCSHI